MPDEVQIGPNCSKKSLTNIVAKHCSRIRESDLSTIYSVCITVFSLRYRLLRVSDFKLDPKWKEKIYIINEGMNE